MYYNVNKIIDTCTYTEIRKNKIYKDKSNIYFNTSTTNNNDAYFIMDLDPVKSEILPGSYIKDMRSIYSFGGVNCIKMDSILPEKFTVLKLKDTISNKVFYRGIFKKNLYWNESKMNREELKNLPINHKQKDSLLKSLF